MGIPKERVMFNLASIDKEVASTAQLRLLIPGNVSNKALDIPFQFPPHLKSDNKLVN